MIKTIRFLIFICCICLLTAILYGIYHEKFSTFQQKDPETSLKKIVFVVHTKTLGGKGVLELYHRMKEVGHDVKVAMIPSYCGIQLLDTVVDFEFAKSFDPNDIVFPCGTEAPFQCTSIEYLAPDYIFTQMPYKMSSNCPLHPHFSNDHLKALSKKMMYIVYGPHIFHQSFINDTDLPEVIDTVFVDSESTKQIYIDQYKFKPEQVAVSGYQPYKEVRSRLNNIHIKNTNFRETILWLPRWMLTFKHRDLHEGGSTFLNYHYYFYNYALNNPHIRLIIRPHCGMFVDHTRCNFLTKEELYGILDKFAKLPNVTISDHKYTDLIDDIFASDVIISDGSSALAEVVVANKPIIYLSNGWNNEFNSNDLSKEFKNHVYLAYDPIDIEQYLIFLRSNKYITNYNMNGFKDMLDPVENPVQFITDYVTHDTLN
ncbi:MAG: hypothetical protein AB8B67_01770 [Rickettsiaceae bacterium]